MWRDRKFADGYTNWAPSEPSNQVSSYAEDCVEMNPVTGKWYDQACSSKRGYICWAPKRNNRQNIQKKIKNGNNYEHWHNLSHKVTTDH